MDVKFCGTQVRTDVDPLKFSRVSGPSELPVSRVKRETSREKTRGFEMHFEFETGVWILYSTVKDRCFTRCLTLMNYIKDYIRILHYCLSKKGDLNRLTNKPYRVLSSFF